MTYDLVVIGGGPGGCSTAITAARTGARVLLLESGRYPRHRVCGEFVSAESLKLLSELVCDASRSLIDNAPRISQSRVFADGAPLHLAITPAAASIPRFDLDLALWNSCLEAGVDARQGSPVRYFHGEGPFTVNANGEGFAAKALVNAAGRWSFLTSSAVRDRASEERWIGVKAHFVEKNPSPTVDLYFCEAGYCGVQPVSVPGMNGGTQKVNACAMFRADVATDLPDIFAAHPALRKRSAEWHLAMDPVRTSPLIFHKPEPVQGTMLQVGDAATFVDPFIGDGISLALRSGALAASCLAPFFQGACTLRRSAADYEELYMRRLAPVFRASSVLRNLLRVPSIIRRPAMSLLQHTPALTRQIVRMTR
ncbi:MAG TPA: NAD(P)/FAD-dependent oxidoreductase [Terriglobales bacterium]